MFQLFKRFKRSEKGQGMVEYGLILALVSVVALGGIGGKLNDTLDKVVGVVSGAETVPDLSEEPIYTDEEVQDLVDNQGYTKVATADDLNNVRNNLGGKYIQVKDIDLSGINNFEPIGTTDNAFKGTFDGGGYTISNLTIDRGLGNFAGLFGYAEGASFKNIGLENVNVTGNDGVGGLVGVQYNSSAVTNSYATGTVTGNDGVGGLVGAQGGLVRAQYSSSTVTNSYATGNVTGNDGVGGLVGDQNYSSATNSYSTGNVTGTGRFVGGLVGGQREGSAVINSYAMGNVTGTARNVGGLVGFQDDSPTTNSYATGNVTGTDNVGGLVGYQYMSSTTDSYATGNVSGNDSVGGLFGYQEDGSTVTSSYATGTVSGNDSVGGLFGGQSTCSTITSSYYDKETTGQSDTGKGMGKTTDDMKNKDTYTGWDFESIWTIESNQYPTHR